VIAFAVSDERTNANDGVIDVLWEPVAENLTNAQSRGGENPTVTAPRPASAPIRWGAAHRCNGMTSFI
jgi:hypothetical protein